MVCQSYCLSTSAKIQLPLPVSDVDVRCVQLPVVGHTLPMTPIWIINGTLSRPSWCNKSNLNQFQSPRAYWILGVMGSYREVKAVPDRILRQSNLWPVFTWTRGGDKLGMSLKAPAQFGVSVTLCRRGLRLDLRQRLYVTTCVTAQSSVFKAEQILTESRTHLNILCWIFEQADSGLTNIRHINAIYASEHCLQLSSWTFECEKSQIIHV